MSRLGLIASVVVVSVVALLGAQDRVASATAGISLVPPPGWHVISMPQVMNNRSQVRVPDAELQAGLQRATAPLFVFSKHPEPFPGLNPTVQVVLRPRPASLPKSSTALLAAATETLRRAFPDFAFVEPIRETTVSGFPAAYMKATYTLKTATQAHRVLSRTWLVPRGAFMFLIGMSGTTAGEDVSEPEFVTTLNSISIEK